MSIFSVWFLPGRFFFGAVFKMASKIVFTFGISPLKYFRGQKPLCLQKITNFFSSFFFSLQTSSVLKDPAAIESVPTLQSNPVGQTTGISSSMVADPRNLHVNASKAGKESLLDQVLNQPIAFATAQDLPREICATLIPADDPLCPTKNASLDYRLEAVGNRLPVAGVGLKRIPRLGKARRRRRSCSLMVWFFVAATLLMVDVVQAVFTPAGGQSYEIGRYALKNAVTSCLSETADGSCPIFAASNDATGNPYGVIGDWDVSLVTRMDRRKCTLSPSLWPRFPLLCF